MRRWALAATTLVTCVISGSAASSPPQTATAAAQASLPDVHTLLADVERNQKRLEVLQQEYTYHVHTVAQQLDKNGGVKKTETEDAQSLTIQGIRVNRVQAKNGTPLSTDEQKKEDARLDQEVAKAKERQAKLQGKGAETDDRGNEILPLSRILELGSFSHPRRVQEGGRPEIMVDYMGNPQAKTRSSFEAVMRDVVGTLWIDEADRVLAHAEGHFLNDFKLGGGLVADVHKGSSFAYRATRVGDGVWLPAEMRGEGSVRILLFAHFNGRLQVTTSDYRRFHASATIVGSHGAIDGEGNPLPNQGTPPPLPVIPPPQ